MGRIFQTQTATPIIPTTGNGRIFGSQDINKQQMKEFPDWPTNEFGNPKAWEELTFGEKTWETSKEIPKVLYNFLPPSSREVLEKGDEMTAGEKISKGLKGGVEFAGMIPEITKQAIGGGILQAKKALIGGREEYTVPGFKKAGEFVSKAGAPHIGEQIAQLGELSSWGVQKKQLEEQGFTPEESAALIGINAYLGIMPIAVKLGKTATAGRIYKTITTKEVPFAETPAGIKEAVITEGKRMPETVISKELKPLIKEQGVFPNQFRYKIGEQEYQWTKPRETGAGIKDRNAGFIQKRNNEGLLMSRSDKSFKNEKDVLDFIKKDAVKGEISPTELPEEAQVKVKEIQPKTEIPKMVKVERPTITAIKKTFGKTEEQKQFHDILQEHTEKYFEGRETLLGKEEPLNKALLKLSDEELKTYSGITQGLVSIEKPSVNLKNAVDLWKKTNQEIETDLIQRGKLKPEQVENRRWKPVEETTGRTREELKSMGIEPIYYPYLAEDLLKKSDFIPTTGKRTKGGYLKRFTGKMLQEDSYIKDPKIAIPRHRVQVFRDKMNSELVDSIKNNFAEMDNALIEQYKNNPHFADIMGVEEWKPSGALRFYKTTFKEVLPQEKLPVIKPAKVLASESIENLKFQIEILETTIKDNPAYQLTKYANKRTGELPEVLGGKGSKFKQFGDDIASELGFETSEGARLAYEKIVKYRGELSNLKQQLKQVKGETIKDYAPNQIQRINELFDNVSEFITRQRTLIGVSKKVESYWIPKEIANELNKFYKPGALEKALRMTYDPLIDMWRVSVLGMAPRWLYNNTIGNMILSTLGKTDPFAFIKSAKEMLARTKLGEKLGIVKQEIPKGVFVKEYAGGEMAKTGKLGGLSREQTQFLRPIENWLNLLEQAKNYKALRIPAAATQSLIRGWIALGKPIGYLNKVVENWFRGAMYISKTEGKFLGMRLDKPVPSAEGLKYVNEFLFDYTKLSRAERATFRRALPFWNWQKNITNFAFKFPAKHPVRGLVVGALLQDYVDYINEINQKEDKTKSILRIKTNMTYEGKPLYLNIKSAIPFSDVFKTLPTNFKAFGRFLTSNPVSKMIIERAFKINSFTGQPFTQPKEMQEFDEYGKPILPIPSLPRHLGQQFPQVKLGEQIKDYLKYGKSLKRYETGEPKLVRGQIQTTDLLMDTLGYFGIKLSAIEYNKIKQQVEKRERLQEVKQKRFESQIKTKLKQLND